MSCPHTFVPLELQHISISNSCHFLVLLAIQEIVLRSGTYPSRPAEKCGKYKPAYSATFFILYIDFIFTAQLNHGSANCLRKSSYEGDDLMPTANSSFVDSSSLTSSRAARKSSKEEVDSMSAPIFSS